MLNRGKCFNNKTVSSNKIYELIDKRSYDLAVA